MQNRNEVFSEEEEAFLRLTEDEEKEYFKEILRMEKENDGYISKKRPKLSVSYYVYKYKNEGVSFHTYLSDSENELLLLKSELSVQDRFGKTRPQGLRNINRYLDEETEKERRLGRKRNTRFAIIVLVLVFVFMIYFFLK